MEKAEREVPPLPEVPTLKKRGGKGKLRNRLHIYWPCGLGKVFLRRKTSKREARNAC